MPDDDLDDLDQKELEAFYASRRVPEKLYVEKSTQMARVSSSDLGQPMRYVHQALDVRHEVTYDPDEDLLVLSESPVRRHQLRALIVRDRGRVREILIHKVQPRAGQPPTVKPIVILKDEQAERLIAFVRALGHIEPQGDRYQVWNEDVLAAILADPRGAPELYRSDPEAFRRLITDDVTARDVVAVAHRREQLDEFEKLLFDDAYFDEMAATGHGREKVWQDFFERNPWIFGCSLTGQLLTSWDPEKLERVVSGGHVGSTEKRIDALMRTKGAVSSIVLAEIKHHRTELIAHRQQPYRSGCWAVSAEVAGAVAQVQGSVTLAVEALGHRLEQHTPDGFVDREHPAFIYQPKTYLVAGRLDEFTAGPGQFHEDKFRSFELFRRNLHAPEILTFDELLERARWIVGAAS